MGALCYNTRRKRRLLMMRCESKYKAIVDALSDEIMAGRYRRPMSFPSVARIVRRFGVAHLTAVKVLDELKKRGLVETRQGSGTFAGSVPNVSSFFHRGGDDHARGGQRGRFHGCPHSTHWPSGREGQRALHVAPPQGTRSLLPRQSRGPAQGALILKQSFRFFDIGLNMFRPIGYLYI